LNNRHRGRYTGCCGFQAATDASVPGFKADWDGVGQAKLAVVGPRSVDRMRAVRCGRTIAPVRGLCGGRPRTKEYEHG